MGAFAVLAPAAVQAETQDAAQTTERLVVRFKPESRPDLAAVVGGRSRAASAGAAANAEALRASLSTRAGRSLEAVRQMADGAVIYQTAGTMTLTEARAAAARVSQDTRVLDASPDVRVYSHAVETPNDPYLSYQWAVQPSGVGLLGGSDYLNAWSWSAGQNVVVAVVDTGWVNHSEFGGTVLPGYDMVTDTAIGGDGDGRDSDPSDPGDACTSKGTSSSWHGLMVSGLIGAAKNNAAGLAGLAPGVSLLPVRAMGQCGGWLSDVADAIRWSAGQLSPVNPNPAQVINLSLGGDAGTSCPSYLQDAITGAVQRGTVVVASAGNNGAAALSSPANCSGVIAVGAHTRSGDLASYSNRHSSLALTAPAGGACMSQGSGVCDTTPILTLSTGNQLKYFSGTSAAAPHVSAVAALMLAVNRQMTPAQVKAILQAQATPHPASSWCASHSGQCGSGMLNALGAVQAAVQPQITVLGVPSASVVGGTALDLSASVAGVGPYTYRWSQTGGAAVALTGADSARLSATVPARSTALSFRLDVTSTSNGQLGSAVVTLAVNNAPDLADQNLTQVGQSAFSLNLPETDADGDALSYLLVSGPDGAAVNGRTLFWPAPQLGSTTFQVQAVDAEGLSSRVAAVTLTVTTVSATTSGTPSSGSLGGTSTAAGVSSGSASTGASTTAASAGGGGSLDFWQVLALLAAAWALHRARVGTAQRAQRKRSSSLREALSKRRRSGTL